MAARYIVSVSTRASPLVLPCHLRYLLLGGGGIASGLLFARVRKMAPPNALHFARKEFRVDGYI